MRFSVSEVERSGVHEVTRSHTNCMDYRYPIELPATCQILWHLVGRPSRLAIDTSYVRL